MGVNGVVNGTEWRSEWIIVGMGHGHGWVGIGGRDGMK